MRLDANDNVFDAVTVCLYKHLDAGGPYLLMAAVMRLVEYLVQGEFEFSEDPPGNQVFDHQIAKLKAQIFFVC
jgi:hypothetical protein